MNKYIDLIRAAGESLDPAPYADAAGRIARCHRLTYAGNCNAIVTALPAPCFFRSSTARHK